VPQKALALLGIGKDQNLHGQVPLMTHYAASSFHLPRQIISCRPGIKPGELNKRAAFEIGDPLDPQHRSALRIMMLSAFIWRAFGGRDPSGQHAPVARLYFASMLIERVLNSL